MITTRGLDRLVQASVRVLGADAGSTSAGPGRAAGKELKTLLAEALDDPNLLPDEVLGSPRLPPSGVAKYLLHQSSDFVLFTTVTAPTTVLPAHDHGSWGLVGLYRGIEEESFYIPMGGADGANGLAEVRRVPHSAGGISEIRPPMVDIHQLWNSGHDNSVSLHLFGKDIVSSGFNFYPTGHLVVRTGPIEYDEIKFAHEF